MNIRDTFLKLVEKTHPHGTEEQLLEILPKLEKDEYGNYYKIIGDNPTTMFNSHLDNYGEEQLNTKPYIDNMDGNDYVFGENSILGADDKAGVTLMLYMINNNIEGLYYFFIGEEVGAVGSKALSENFDTITHLSNIAKCISFDRHGENSIITHQSNKRSCSNQFASTLKELFSDCDLEYNLDDTGIYSDSASFMGKIEECTNISVGYHNEHTKDEHQNITFLEKLSKACVSIDWETIKVYKNTNEHFKYIKTFSSFLN